ncbi:MAG: hypothetical protein ACHQD8_03200 [Chitinophagales bacterium]
MELIETGYDEYNLIFNAPYHVFNTAGFNDLNKHKCDGVKYLLFKERKYRLGLIAGVKNNMLISPFSAPFGGFSFLKDSLQISHIEASISLLEEYVLQNNFVGIKLILPPLFYNETFLAKLMNVLYRKHFKTSNLDLDFYFDLDSGIAYNEQIWYNARKNLKMSMESVIGFNICENTEEIKEVYGVIEANRIAKGFPMTMKHEEIIATSKIIPADFFLCYKDGQSIAAAIVYHVNEHIVYVPYWGDRDGFSEMRPMNFLVYKIFGHYKSIGKRKVHIGIATEDSVPNYGLCEFKESIGCKISPKFTFTKMF